MVESGGNIFEPKIICNAIAKAKARHLPQSSTRTRSPNLSLSPISTVTMGHLSFALALVQEKKNRETDEVQKFASLFGTLFFFFLPVAVQQVPSCPRLFPRPIRWKFASLKRTLDRLCYTLARRRFRGLLETSSFNPKCDWKYKNDTIFVQSLVIKKKKKKDGREVKPKGYRTWAITSRRVCMFIRQRRITVAPFQSLPIFVYLSLYSFHIVCLFYQNVFSRIYFSLAFLFSLLSFSLLFILENK